MVTKCILTIRGGQAHSRTTSKLSHVIPPAPEFKSANEIYWEAERPELRKKKCPLGFRSER